MCTVCVILFVISFETIFNLVFINIQKWLKNCICVRRWEEIVVKNCMKSLSTWLLNAHLIAKICFSELWQIVDKAWFSTVFFDSLLTRILVQLNYRMIEYFWFQTSMSRTVIFVLVFEPARDGLSSICPSIWFGIIFLSTKLMNFSKVIFKFLYCLQYTIDRNFDRCFELFFLIIDRQYLEYQLIRSNLSLSTMKNSSVLTDVRKINVDPKSFWSFLKNS